jgi:signal transduction histidine kinase
MKPDRWFRPPRHLLPMFLLISLGPAAALGWLSWRLLEQDRALAAQRIQERIENAADMASAYLRQGQAEVEENLARLAALPLADLPAAATLEADNLGNGVLLVSFRREEIHAFPRERLLYLPYLPPVQEPSEAVFTVGENYEFRNQDYSRAIVIFRKLSTSVDAAIRGGALVRLARTLRKAGRFDEAMAAYDELERLGSQRIGSVGLPAELLARHSRCSVLEELKRTSDLRSAAEALKQDLVGARWLLMRAAYEFYRRETLRWLGLDAADQFGPAAEGPALAAAVESLWDDWQRIRMGEGSQKGRKSLWLHNQPVLLVWNATPEQLVALVVGCRYFEEQMHSLMATVLREGPLQPALMDLEGHLVFGRTPSPGTPYSQRAATELRLPWTLYIASSNPAADIADLASQRRLLLGGLAMMAVLLIAGIYFIGRSVKREIELAQLKSDFVSAVSHEFRSPLTSMRQLTGMLATGRVPNEERRQSYYDVLSAETVRLQRLVEGLLDFGRMEAGAMEYSFKSIDISDLVRRVIADFQREVQEDGYRIELVGDNPGPTIRADQEALSRALWNLLDNAVKYSPDCRTVRVELERKEHELFVQVQDRGVGMSPGEQRDIFRKFVRGAAATATHAKGTGIGLAVVDHIARAHGGRVQVESEPGRGSTFTLILPVEE